MHAVTLTFIAVSALLTTNAAPLVERGSVGHLSSENHASNAAAGTPPPWRVAASASSFVALAERATQPTPPPWKRASAPAPTESHNSPGADAPGWRAAHTSPVLERAQPTPPPWKRESVAPRQHAKTDSSPVTADAPGWKKRVVGADADPTTSLSRSA
ncbi:hypothetical protein B0H13DRAFT_2655203 [Mycena leptocephala]|nr:hypothetical protein B0H13DRAFT_2655203 [Mycena leptocephala]